MTEPTTEVAKPLTPVQMHPVQWSAGFGLLLVLISAVVVSSARSISPIRLKVQNIDGIDGLYGTSSAEYVWIAIGLVIGLVGVSFIGVAVIAKGIQIGRR